ncbi:hypothetical protein HG536_0F03420 [Torulaspora globosa]|uniref:ABC transporter domain-containing protein n=1 Tax=Torulaspora globosa TaxID=48254 RepID=A0A7G3ZKI1_9SACH|nr:uncharacterized protein HG536_0F03420 [Torulaspora globosa]QLL34017.1 hypothetical protein HG536_0F03420 [Torulaspora globosa]
MPLSTYFAAVPGTSLTFDGANIILDENYKLPGNDDFEANLGNSRVLRDLVFTAEGSEMVLVLGSSSSLLLEALSSNQRQRYFPEGSVRFKTGDYWRYLKESSQVIYSNEGDVHFPHLTVQQTIDFALSCKYNAPKIQKNQLRDELLQEFGLYHVRNTRVGNDYVRGISGGQRRRVSIIETFIANGSVYLWDNCTKGLDSSTALDFLTILRDMTKRSKSVSLVRISQASDEIVSKFDKILMLSEDHQVFFGTMEECLHHFESTLQIARNPNDSIIEYLTSILRHSSDISRAPKVTLSEEQLYRAWERSRNYQYWKSKVKYDSTDNEIISISACVAQKDGVGMLGQLSTCTKRAFQRIAADKSSMIAEFISVTVQALVIGSLFYNIPLTTIGSFSRGSLTFFSLLFYTFMALTNLPNDFQRQGIIKKQLQLNFYSRWIEALASIICDCTFKMVLVITFTLILYFLAHFQYNASRFFIFLLFLAVYNFSMVSLFSFIAYIAPTVAIANTIAGILLLAIAMYASYVIYLSAMHPWFVWIAYLNPAMYAMEAILSNELFNLKLDCSESIVPRGSTYNNVSFKHKACAWQGATLGNDFVRGRDYLNSGLHYSYDHVWRNFGIILGFLFFYLVISLVAAEYIKPLFTRRHAGVLRRLLNFRNIKKDNLEEKRPIRNADSMTMPSLESSTSSESTDSITYLGGVKKYQPTAHGNFSENAPAVHVVTWKDVRFSIGDKIIINNTSGYVSSGLTALMGESGAGKTTLLNILSQRTKGGKLEGQILVDGKIISDIGAFRRSIGFVQQQDVLLQGLTVRETLEVSSTLRGDSDMEYIHTVAAMLDLSFNKLVVDLSPTERKLLSIGVELVTKPSTLLLLDEPTSGLDPHAALTIVKFLKELSLRGHAILCTIHQPSKSVFEHFDSIYLLQGEGKCAYFGPADRVCNYFTTKDRHLKYRPEQNPAEFIIDAVGNSRRQLDDLHDASGIMTANYDWSTVWMDSNENQRVLKIAQDLEVKANLSALDLSKTSHTNKPFLKQLLVITKRQYLCIRRDKSYVVSKFLLNGGAGLFIGFSFWKTKHNIDGLRNAIFLCFMSLCVSSPLINQVQDKALESKEVYLEREASSNTYHWSILLLAQLLVEIPLAIASSTVFFLCCYFCCGYDSSPQIAGVFYFNYILFSVYYLSFGLWLIYSAPNAQTAAVFVAFLYSFTASFCGVMQPYDLFPGFWKFMYRVSPYTYFVDTFVSLLLHDRPVICDTDELVPTSPSDGQTCGEFLKAFVEEYGGAIKNPSSRTVCAYCPYKVGDDFLRQQHMSFDNRWRNFGVQCAFISFNVAAMFVGFYLVHVKIVWHAVSKLPRRILGRKVPGVL